MATLTIRMPDDKANRLKILARSRGISVNKLIEEWATMGIAEFDSYASFLARSTRGSRESALAAMRELENRDHERKRERRSGDERRGTERPEAEVASEE